MRIKNAKETIADFNDTFIEISFVAKCLTSSLYEIRNVIIPSTTPQITPITRKKTFFPI
jgi:hypothetical protein